MGNLAALPHGEHAVLSMLRLTPTLPSILLGIFLFSGKPMDSSNSLVTHALGGQNMWEKLQSHPGPECAFVPIKGQSYQGSNSSKWESYRVLRTEQQAGLMCFSNGQNEYTQ